MINLKGLCGLAPGLISQSPRFTGTGMVIKPLPVYDQRTGNLCDFNAEMGVAPWMQIYTSVRLSVGPNSIRFVIDASDLMAFLRRPVILLRNAILSAQKAGIAPVSWRGLFDRSGNSPITIDIHRYYLLAAIFEDNGQVYNPPLGASSPLVLLSISKTAGEGILALANNQQVDLFKQPMAISIVPQPAKSSGGVITPSSYAVRSIPMPYNFDFTNTLNMILTKKLGWHNILTPLDPKDEVILLTQSQVPASAIVYALAGSEWQDLLPQQYLSLGLAKLNQEAHGGNLPQAEFSTQSFIPPRGVPHPEFSPSTPNPSFIPPSAISQLQPPPMAPPEQSGEGWGVGISLEELRKILDQARRGSQANE